MRRCAIYCRISKSKQSKYSMEAQEKRCREYAKKNNLKVFKIYKDKRSGLNIENRKGLLQLMRDANNFEIVLTTDRDRLSRNPDDNVIIRYELKDCEFIAIDEPNRKKSEFDELIDKFMSIISWWETKKRNLRIKRMKALAIERGKVPHMLPIGYKKNEDGSVIIDQDAREFVIETFERYANRDSLYKIANDRGTSRSAIRYMLSNNFYVDFKKPLISKGLFNQVQKRFQKRNRGTKKKISL